MKTFIADIIPKIKKFSEKLDNITYLTNQHWVVIDELKNTKFVYIFRSNKELLISQNGKVVKGKWEYLGNNSLLIEKKDESFLFRHGFFDRNILALKVDGKDEYAFLVNENNYGGELNTIDKVLAFLESKYLNIIPSNQIHYNEINEISPSISKILIQDLNVIENESGKFGYINREGEMIIDFLYDQAYDFVEGFAVVFNKGNPYDKYGFIDELGNITIPLKYEYAESFCEGLALVRLNRKFGFINKKGEIVIDILYDYADSFNSGKARVKTRDYYYFIDKNGKKI